MKMTFKASLSPTRWNYFGQFSTTVHHEKEFLRLHASKFFNFSFFVFRIQDETTTSIHFPLLLQNDFVVSSLLPTMTNSMSLWLCITNSPSSSSKIDFFREKIPQISIENPWKTISYQHSNDDKNEGPEQ